MQNIEQKLESAFGKKTDIDSRLKSACSNVLTQKIDFQESSRPHSSVSDMLKGKYVNLAPAATVASPSQTNSKSAENDGEGLPKPKYIIFKEPLDFTWKYQRSGTGLHNCGNTCFLNATLQILIHTPPLTNYMTSGHHASVCRLSHEKCILCNLQRLTRLSLNAGESLSPKWFTNNLQYIGRHFRSGRQEDAHEFLRLSLEKMQKCALFGFNNLDKYSKETTVINQIFGGYLRSQVLCCRCGHRSNTYDPLLDISLDIKSADNIERAFQQFVAAEKLEHENAYKCERCKQKVTAFKRFSIHTAPNVLTIQLKRFQFGVSGGFYGNKIHKPVRYPLVLNIRPFMSEKSGPDMNYTLFGSIQHEGMSCGSGHYVANVRCGKDWYHFNDSSRYMRNGQHCLNENSAYILFYIKETGATPQIAPAVRVQKAVASVKESFERKLKPQTNGLGHSSTVVKSPSSHNQQLKSGLQPKIATPTNEARNQKMVGQQTHRLNSVPSNEIGKTIKSPFVPLSADREKVKFNIGGDKHKTPSPLKTTTPNKSEVNSSKRLVVKINVTDGKSFTWETSPDGEKRMISDDDEVVAKMSRRQRKRLRKKQSIVPYGPDSDSDWSSSNSSQDHSASSSKKSCKDYNQEQNGLVFDGALNTTTSVPGNAHLFSTVTMKDKVSHNTPHADRPKDIKMFSPKSSHQSPSLKRHFNETLSCDTAATAAKHSGNGEWRTTIESLQSPSIGSNHSQSSVHSNGSTNDWSVQNKDKTSNGHSERKPEGWIITPGKKEKSNKSVSEEHGKSNYVRADTNCASSPFEDVSDKVYLIKPDRSSDENIDEYRKLKKHKKHKKRKHHEREHNYAEVSEESSSRSHKKKKKKKHKHKDRDEDREERKRRKYEREKSNEEKDSERVEKSHKRADREDEGPREKHREDEGHQQKHREDEGHRQKHMEDEGHRQKHREIEEHRQKHGEDEGHRQKHKEDEGHRQKHREDEGHRQKHREDEGHRQKQMEDERYKHHRYRHDRDGCEVSHKKICNDSESSNEFEWVEKTVPARASVSEPVTPSRWDHHVKDGYKRVSSSGTSTPTISNSWDGLKASKVVQELEKVSSYSYGAPVSGWDGSKSQMDVEKDRENISHKRKDSDDEYNEDYDRGKVKKVKHKHHSEHRSHGNIFQQKQDQINRSKINWSTIKIGENNPFSNKQQPDRPHHHQNSR